MVKRKSFVVVCVWAVLVVAGCVSIPGKDNPSAYTRSYVQDAIRFYEREGRQALVERYNSVESMDGQWYLFVSDENNILFVHPESELVGMDLLEIVDATGYRSGEAISATTEQGQWFTYSGFNYETGQQARKHAWCIRHDGLIFGSGWHEE